MHAIEGTISRFSDGTTMLLRCEGLEPPVSHLGHERRFRYLRGTSAYPPRLAVKADIPDRQLRARTRHCDVNFFTFLLTNLC